MSTPADPDAPGRRSLLVMLAVFAGLTVVVVLASTIAGAMGSESAREPVATAVPEAEVRAFLGPLASEDLDGWVIEQIHGRRAGGLPLVLRGPGGIRLEVELRPLDARSPPAPAASGTLAVYVHGREMPQEGLMGVLALARGLRSREAVGARLTGIEPLLMGR